MKKHSSSHHSQLRAAISVQMAIVLAVIALGVVILAYEWYSAEHVNIQAKGEKVPKIHKHAKKSHSGKNKEKGEKKPKSDDSAKTK